MGDAVGSRHQVLHEAVHANPSPSSEPLLPRKLARLLAGEEIVPLEFAVDPEELDGRPAIDRRLGMYIRRNQESEDGCDGRGVF